MTDHELLERIHVDPRIMMGQPGIRGTRLTVDFILGLLAHGSTVEEILREYAGLDPDDVRACVLYADRQPR